MPSTNDYLVYILELLRNIDGISYKKMMGEYLLYKDGVLFGGIYDNRFLIKKVSSLSNENLREEIPYDGAKTMLLVDIENPEKIEHLITSVITDLKRK